MEDEKDEPELNGGDNSEVKVAKINSTQIIITTLITAFTSVIVTLISTGTFSTNESNKEEKKEQVEVENESLSFPFFKTKSGEIVNLKELHNQGIRIISTDTKMDWSARIEDLDRDKKDSERASPGIQDEIINFVRLTEDAKFFVKKFASQRKLIDITSQSHRDYDVAYFSKEQLKAEDKTSGLTNYWYLIINIEDHHINLEQKITFRAIRWNAFQSDNNNYWGRLVIGNEEQSNISILLPHDKEISSNPRLTIQLSGQTTPELEFNPLPTDTIIKPGFFSWNIRTPKSEYIYRAYIDWKKK